MAFNHSTSLFSAKPLVADIEDFVNKVNRLCELESEQYLTKEKKADLQQLQKSCGKQIQLSHQRLFYACLSSLFNWMQDNEYKEGSGAHFLQESPLEYYRECLKKK